MSNPPLIEVLESRIAPAAAITFTDLDGDLVTVKTSKGTPAELAAAAGDLNDHRLQTLDLSGTADFDGSSVTITAVPQHGKGDGLVNIGRINATGRVLGAVVVSGDLGVLDAGNTAVNAVAVQSLTVQSIGESYLSTGAPDLTSDLAGAVKSITVKGDIRNALINITGQDPKQDPVTHLNRPSYLGALSIGGSLLATNTTDLGSILVNGDIASIKIGGSVISGGAQASAEIGASHGSIGPITIGGDLIVGTGGFSAYIFAAKNVGNVSVGGDVRGGGSSGANGGNSGLILAGAGSMGAVKIGGSLIGGAGTYGGSVVASTAANATGSMGAVTIGGSVIGGSGAQSAFLFAAGGMGTVQIGGNLVGGTAGNSGLVETGSGNIAGVTVHGSMLGGTQDYTGSIAAGAFAGGVGKLGPVVIGGHVTGGAASTATRSGLIAAAGDITFVSIGGSLTGGGGGDSGLINTSASLGVIKIGGDLAGGGGVRTGRIGAVVNIGSVSIAGSMLGSASEGSGSIVLGQVMSGKQQVGAITIGGSVIGVGQSSGGIYTNQSNTDSFGPLRVGGDWKGGSGSNSGRLESSKISSISIGGSFVGGGASFAGYLNPGSCTSIVIGGDVVGGSSTSAGSIITSLTTLTIHGSIIGGTATQTGFVDLGSASTVVIGHDIRGGSSAASDVAQTGFLFVNQAGSITIGGSLIAGQQTGAGKLTNSGSIGVGVAGSLTVKGSVVGNAASQVRILAVGDLFGDKLTDVALQSLTVVGRVEFALIAAGLDDRLNSEDADAQIGAVRIGGDWIASSLIAGVDAKDGRIGDGNDVKINPAIRDNAAVFSKIASITIGGQILGKAGDASTTYGFGAEEIGSFKVGGVTLPLRLGKSNDQFTSLGVVGSALPVGISPGSVVNDGFTVHVFEVA